MPQPARSVTFRRGALRGTGSAFLFIRSALAMVSIISGCAKSFLKTLGGFRTRCSGVYLTERWFSDNSGSPRPPKRPISAYLRYAMEQQPILIKQNPDVKIVEITKQIALGWKELSVAQKQPYEAIADVHKQKYREEMEKYKAQLTPAQLAALQEQRRQKMAKRKLIRRKRELTMLGKPKRPRSAFNIFMAEHFEEAKGATMQAKMKTLFEDWNNFHTSQKQIVAILSGGAWNHGQQPSSNGPS
ncbi:transcription factor A, mitochondrial isoform X2 [Latimeria chalumnae]|uniref:transcription factor A, mitochondrial isoform X2 n=1 Tax=Latimeria chalumnae TaxID=7897 RepID=UPI00313DF29B